MLDTCRGGADLDHARLLYFKFGDGTPKNLYRTALSLIAALEDADVGWKRVNRGTPPGTQESAVS